MAASTFSYAQAAKGMSTPAVQSKPASGATSPAPEAAAAASQAPITSNPSWAEESEIDSLVDPREAPAPKSTKSVKPSPATDVEPSLVSSPDLGASSSSTVTKDDDISSLHNTSSDSTWDNKSQASTSVDKSNEAVEKTSEKVSKGKNVELKPLQDAPVPTVNIWKLRADELKAKTQKAGAPVTNGTPQAAAGAFAAKGMAHNKDASAISNGYPKGVDDSRPGNGRREAKAEGDFKKGAKGKPFEKDSKTTPHTLPLPPARDQESWPTPETALDEDRKKTQGKGDKMEKERKESISTGPHGKHEWVKVPYTPSVIFNTPLPSSANMRRGGRPGGRGGAQAGGRSTGPTNATGPSEKDTPASNSVGINDQPRRERIDGADVKDHSNPSRANGVVPESTLQSDVPLIVGEKPSKSATIASAEFNGQPRKSAYALETSQAANSNSNFTRSYNKNSKPRRGDYSNSGERRRDDTMSPTKDGAFEDRRTWNHHQGDAQNDVERRNANHPDGSSKQGRFGTYASSRDRPRGNGRGPRGGFANGHQFANGHSISPQHTSTYPFGARSPPAYNAENNFFAGGQGKYGRGGHRSQSVADSYRYSPFPSGPSVPQLQTYNMYDYNMNQPMSAVPYTSYVDQWALASMLTTQIEYYFSVDNLIKDMYLRKHMDTQGFVLFDFIANFNRIKQLSADKELVRAVCQQSQSIEYRRGDDNQDRLRRRDGWQQWVLDKSERDESAQNDGPKELHYPPNPRPQTFENSNALQWPTSAVLPTPPYGSDTPYPQTNGNHPGATQNATQSENQSKDNGNSGSSDGRAIANDHTAHPIENSTVSQEPDSFPDAQVDHLRVIFYYQIQSVMPISPPSFSQSYTNNSTSSKSSTSDGSEDVSDVFSSEDSATLNGSVYSLASETATLPPSSRVHSPAPVHHLCWLKDQENPVHSIPSDAQYELYQHFRSTALLLRFQPGPGVTHSAMEALYQFWSHFLVHNFNTRMYDEFHDFALEDDLERNTNVGISNLIKFFNGCLCSTQHVIRERLVKDLVLLAAMERGRNRPASELLKRALRNDETNPITRELILGHVHGDLAKWLDF